MELFRISYDPLRKQWVLSTPDWPDTYHRSKRAALAHYEAAYRAHLQEQVAPSRPGCYSEP